MLISILAIIKFHNLDKSDLLLHYPVGDRYFIIYNYFTVFSISYIIFKKIKNMWQYYGILLLVIINILTNKFFTHNHYKMKDYEWKKQVELIRNNDAVVLDINPEGWKVEINATNINR